MPTAWSFRDSNIHEEDINKIFIDFSRREAACFDGVHRGAEHGDGQRQEVLHREPPGRDGAAHAPPPARRVRVQFHMTWNYISSFLLRFGIRIQKMMSENGSQDLNHDSKGYLVLPYRKSMEFGFIESFYESRFQIRLFPSE